LGEAHDIQNQAEANGRRRRSGKNAVVVDFWREKVRKVSDDDEETEKIVKCAVKRDTIEETVFHTFKCVMKNKPKFSPVD
jgi:hypothetical protein